MNKWSEASDNIEECKCGSCKNVFWVPYYDGMVDMGHPSFCPFCGSGFDSVREMDEDDTEREN